MKPNILFVLVDSLRADQCYGEDKTSYTPFLDSLLKNGLYFKNTFSSSDGTIISLNCLLNSKFQFETGVRSRKIILLEDNHLQTLKDSGYYLTGIFPNLTSFKPIHHYFENTENTLECGPPPQTLTTGMNEKIKLLLASLPKEKPWFCYIHLLDLHPLREGKIPPKIKEFQSDKFGNSLYAQTVSSIDHHLKKILKTYHEKNTILIITADHGERIPHGEKSNTQLEPELKSMTNAGKKLLPKKMHNTGGKIMSKFRTSIGKAKTTHLNRSFTPYEKRSRDPYFTLSLNHELLHIPLFISGLDLSPKIISNLASTLDIFPTIFDMAGIPYTNSKYSHSLLSFIKNDNSLERKLFLHTSPYENESPQDAIGIQTTSYRYFRNTKNPKKNVHLYDLENDPYENENISDKFPVIVKEMESEIEEMTKESVQNDFEKLSDEERKIIETELGKMGYL